ncbi:MAG TPA: hemerythrin domain-containing protein, partial [Candidatus Parcubacteria bacterium]|nr:hemerythrin domain-containing protein [Candidatus Parcubacteria bacterium]
MSKTCEHQHNCIKELKTDHEEILKKLDLLKKAADGSEIDKKQVKEFLHFTETFAEPHHKKEEEVLFPELEKKGIPKEGGPIGVMLLEHEKKRNHVRKLKEALNEDNESQIKESSLAIISLLQDHINKENDCLYPMAEEVLSKEDLSNLAHRC